MTESSIKAIRSNPSSEASLLFTIESAVIVTIPLFPGRGGVNEYRFVNISSYHKFTPLSSSRCLVGVSTVIDNGSRL